MKVQNSILSQELALLFPNLGAEIECPQCEYPSDVFTTIQHLNDLHYTKESGGWTREKIADWLEALDIDLTMASGDEYDEAQKRIAAERQHWERKKSAEAAWMDQLLGAKSQYWMDEVQKFYTWEPTDPVKTQEELLKERLNKSLQEGMEKVSESLTQFGAACTDALEAIQKFSINYQEIIKKEQPA